MYKIQYEMTNKSQLNTELGKTSMLVFNFSEYFSLKYTLYTHIRQRANNTDGSSPALSAAGSDVIPGFSPWGQQGQSTQWTALPQWNLRQPVGENWLHVKLQATEVILSGGERCVSGAILGHDEALKSSRS